MLVRLQKYLAEAGVGSRRASEDVIQAGRVKVNGRLVREMGTKVDPVRDAVTVDGASIRPKRKAYVALNKPTGYISSRRDPEGRRTLGELLPAHWANLYPVGRLDYETEGLIFLTNDGDFALRLTHPRYGVRKKYHAVVEGKVETNLAEQLTRGVVHDGERLKAERARILKSGRTSSLVELELAEGKNREARRMFEALRLSVLNLKRVQIGPIKLGELRSGRWRTLTDSEIRALLGPSGPARRDGGRPALTLPAPKI